MTNTVRRLDWDQCQKGFTYFRRIFDILICPALLSLMAKMVKHTHAHTHTHTHTPTHTHTHIGVLVLFVFCVRKVSAKPLALHSPQKRHIKAKA
jgi:hypothetical protein